MTGNLRKWQMSHTEAISQKPQVVWHYYLVGILFVGVQCHSVTFNLESARVFYPTTFETYVSYHKDICVAAAGCHDVTILFNCVTLYFTDIFSFCNVISPTIYNQHFFTSPIPHGFQHHFPKLCGTGISDATFSF